jgi:hypothetical protein
LRRPQDAYTREKERDHLWPSFVAERRRRRKRRHNLLVCIGFSTATKLFVPSAGLALFFTQTKSPFHIIIRLEQSRIHKYRRRE